MGLTYRKGNLWGVEPFGHANDANGEKIYVLSVKFDEGRWSCSLVVVYDTNVSDVDLVGSGVPCSCQLCESRPLPGNAS